MSLKTLFLGHKCGVSPDVARATKGVYDAIETAREVIRKLADADEEYAAEQIRGKRQQ